MATKSKRQSNFELLRIVAMLMIIAHHFSVHGKFDFGELPVSFNEVWINLLWMGGKLGVNLFVLISGYFLCSRTNLDFGKVGKLYTQIWVTSVALYVLQVLFGNPFSLKRFIQACMPITFELWWFASTYFVLFLFSPFINRAIQGLTKKQHAASMVVLFVMWSVIPNVLSRTLQMNNLLWFVFLYIVAAYIRKYGSDVPKAAYKWLLLAAGVALLMFGGVVATDIFGVLPIELGLQSSEMYAMNSIMMVLLSVFLFLGFKNLKMPYLPWINWIAASTFGVYLIHDSGHLRTLLWSDLFKNASFKESPYLVIYSMGCILAVFIVCTLLDRVRILIFGKWYDRLLEKGISNIRKLTRNIVKS